MTGCTATTLPTAAIDPAFPLGIARDFSAVFESRDGSLTSTTEVTQAGTGFVLKRSAGTGSVLCDNLTASLRCSSGTGILMPQEEAEKTLRIEAMTAQRLIGQKRVLGDDVAAKEQAVPKGLKLFSETAFSALVQSMVQPTTATLENCYIKTTTEEKEFFCFGGGLMPYWADTTFTPIGDVVMFRLLRAYSTTALTKEQLQKIYQDYKE